MQLLDIKCPACGASVPGALKSRIVVCEYCGTRFMLDGTGAVADEAAKALEDEAKSAVSMETYASDECSVFLLNSDESYFKSAPKILKGLNIGSDETVYLIHDDTFMKSGKNGFAITDKGLHCRGQGEDAAFLDWKTYAKMAEPEDGGAGTIKCGSRLVGYFTDDSDVLDELVELFKKLHHHAALRFA